MEQVTTATSFPHRWVSNWSFPSWPLVFGWGASHSLGLSPPPPTPCQCRAARGHSCCPWCWRGGFSHHSREDTGSGDDQHWAQKLPMRICHEVCLWGRIFCLPCAVALWRLHGHCPWPLTQSVVVPVTIHHHLQCLGDTTLWTCLWYLMNFKKFCILRSFCRYSQQHVMWRRACYQIYILENLMWYFFDLKITID